MHCFYFDLPYWLNSLLVLLRQYNINKTSSIRKIILSNTSVVNKNKGSSFARNFLDVEN